MKQEIKKRNIPPEVYLLPILVVMAVMVFYDAGVFKSPTPHKDPPSADVVCVADAKVYSLGETENIRITVTNHGDYTGEMDKPYLEVQERGQWYVVKKCAGQGEPANLLTISAGATQEYDIPLTLYSGELKPGKYRAVFVFAWIEDYFAYEFELTE